MNPPATPQPQASQAGGQVVAPVASPNVPPVSAPTYQTPEIQSGQSVVTTRHHVSKLMFLVPAVLIIATLSGVAFYVNRGKSPIVQTPSGLEPSPQATATPTELPIATVVPTPKAELQIVTYKNTEGAFVFDYPNSLFVIECATGIKILKEKVDFDAKASCTLEPTGVISVEFSNKEFETGYEKTNEYQDNTRILNLSAQTAILYDYTR